MKFWRSRSRGSDSGVIFLTHGRERVLLVFTTVHWYRLAATDWLHIPPSQQQLEAPTLAGHIKCPDG